MLRVIRGRKLQEVDVGEVRRLADRHARVALDLGTGDGRSVLALAAARPDTLVIGVDANASGMTESSRRASRRDALPNALFAVAAAEQPPGPLRGLAGALTIQFPWGSLLRGVLGGDDAVLAGVAALLAPGAEGAALVSQRVGTYRSPRTAVAVPAQTAGIERVGSSGRGDECRLMRP